MESPQLRLDQLVHSRERLLFAVMVVVGLLVYLTLGAVAVTDPASGGVILFYAGLFALAGFFVHGLALGRIRGNGVLVSERQFPLLHRFAVEYSQRLNLAKVPTFYVVQSGGVLNAFAAKMLGRKFVIIYSDVLAMALGEGGAAVGFIVAHELGHHWRPHLNWRWLTAPARLIPYLGGAYSRACEYTCDRVGAYCRPDGAIDGLLALAAGGGLLRHVNAREFAAQGEQDRGFWIRRAELISTHPRLPKRVAALLDLGVAVRAEQPMASRGVTAA